MDPNFLYLGSSRRWVVSFMPLPLYPQGKSSRYPLDRRLGGPQSRCGRHGETKIFAPPGLKPRSLGRPARSQSLYRLRYHSYKKNVVTLNNYDFPTRLGSTKSAVLVYSLSVGKGAQNIYVLLTARAFWFLGWQKMNPPHHSYTPSMWYLAT
jgi:hypothetical protein